MHLVIVIVSDAMLLFYFIIYLLTQCLECCRAHVSCLFMQTYVILMTQNILACIPKQINVCPKVGIGYRRIPIVSASNSRRSLIVGVIV